MPSRTWATRAPASRAGSAAASHSRHTSARKSSAAGSVSVCTWPGRSPYQPIAEATTSAGLDPIAAIRSASSRVEFTRLWRIRRFLVSFHRPMIDSPARWMTASTPSSAPSSIWLSEGSQRNSPGSSGLLRVSLRTVCPPVESIAHSVRPTSPLAPVTSTVFGVDPTA